MERRESFIEVANGLQAEVEAVGDVCLDLVDGFILSLRDVFYVPSVNKNMICISRLDKDGFECHFGHGQCAIWCNNACGGIAYLHDDLYLLSLHEKLIPCAM
jgi:hypothetical protein